ncbi:uncharacterized protein CBL_02473 [Carabus blaptoides fortunei]
MGPKSDKTAVVDPRLRVFGIDGLRVIDASIMPAVPAAHTNTPTYMVAEKGKTEDWKQVLDTNILGLCICTREAAKSMKENTIDGHIVHINSIGGHWVGNFPRINVYGASKFAVTALTDTLRKEFNSNGSKIKVTSVSPGAVRTEMMTSVDSETIKHIPALESEDVADAVLYAIEGKTEDWKKIFDTNILGLCICTREAAKSMKENTIDGHLVNINSICGHWVGNFPNMNVYGPSKFAVTALTDTLRKEFNSNGSKIKMTSVSPGAVRTELMTSVDSEIIKNIPILESEDVADAVLYAIGTAPHILIQELIMRSVGEIF